MGRHEQILDIAAELFAARGFHGVSVADLGQACGMSGPGLYRHFKSKESILSEMLIAISEELLSEGRRRVREAGDGAGALAALVEWHVSFALDHQPLIVVQDRDWAALPVEARERVRETQRRYVEVWVKVLRGLRPELAPRTCRAMVHAAFGLINSTPHSALVPEDDMRRLLAQMANGALSA